MWQPRGLSIAVGILFALVGGGISPVSATAQAQARRPNVIFFLADDLGWRDTTPYGSTFYETPNVERLAQRGMRFTNAYASNPLCSPTRASILTGKFPARLRITTPAGHIREEVLHPVLPEQGPPSQKAMTPQTRNRLLLEEFTLAEALKAAGYATAHVGKWHLGWEPYHPQAQGFDVAIPGGSYPGPPGTYFSPFKAPIFEGAQPGTHIDTLCTDAAIAWIKEHKDQPFFLNYWFFSVHAPWDGATPEQRAKYKAKADPSSPQRNPIMGGMVENLDKNLGRILDALEELGLSENTIVVFTSDNGGVTWQDVEGSPVTSNLPLRNGKASIYEGGTREPSIVVWPGQVAAASTCDQPIMSIDYYPTLLAMLGLKPREGQQFDGISIVPALKQTGPLPRENLFCHFPHYTPASSNLPATWVRQGDWKLIRFYADNPDQTDRFELYNLKDDLGETTDQAGRQPERVRQMNALIDGFLKDTDALYPKPNPAYRTQAQTGGWTPSKDARISREDDGILLVSSGGDPFMVATELQGGTGPYTLEILMKSNSRGEARVYWSEGPRMGFAKERSVPLEIRHDGEPHAYRVAVPCKGAMRSLRIDPSAAPGEIRFQSIRVQDSQGKLVREWPEPSRN